MVDSIIRSFDVWTEAQSIKSKGRVKSIANISLEGIQHLREMILELAIRGKLVPQDPKDEPASELLKRIEKEKAKLVKGEKRKRETDLFECDEADEPYELPQGWRWTLLNNISDINGGYAFKSSNYSDNGYRVIRISDFDEFGFKEQELVRHAFNKDLEPFLLNEKNILMAMTGGTVGKSLLVKEVKEPMIVNQRVATINIAKPISEEYINCVIQTGLIKDVIEEAKNSTNDNISMGDIRGFKMPLPPLPEQARIVAKVEELMVLCNKLEEAKAIHLKTHQTLVKTLLQTLTDAPDAAEVEKAWQRLCPHFDTLFCTEDSIEQLKQTVLRLAVMGRLVAQDPADEPAGELLKRIEKEKAKLVKDGKLKKQAVLPEIKEEEKVFELPVRWVWCRLVQICDLITDGTHQTPKYVDKGRMFLSAQNVKPFKFMPENYKCVSEEDYQGYIKSRRPDKGDVLITRVGAGIGEAAVIDIDIEFAFYVSLGLLKPSKECINSYYLELYLNSPLGRALSGSNTLGKGVSAGNLNLTLIRNFKIPLPPLEEQKRIVAKVEELMSLCDGLKAAMKKREVTKLLLSKTIVANAVA